MAFDPDAFLAEGGGTAVTEATFDPDKFLAQDSATFDPDAFLAGSPPVVSAATPSVNTGDYTISSAKAAPTNAVPILQPVDGQWTPEAIAAHNAGADELNPPTPAAIAERDYNAAAEPWLRMRMGDVRYTSAELDKMQTPRIEAREATPIADAWENVKRAVFVTEQQKYDESIPITQPDGTVKYEYKPFASRLDRTGVMTPLLETKMMEPEADDSALDATGKATFNFMAGLVNFGLSPLGIATVGLGAASGATARAAGFAPAGLGAEGTVAAQTAARLATTARVVSGGFAVDMASAVPEQYKAATESPTLQGKVEGWLGAVSSLGFAALAAKHAAKQPLNPVERQTVENVVELAKRAPDAVLETVARNREADTYSRNLAQAELIRRFKERQAALAPETTAAADAAEVAQPPSRVGSASPASPEYQYESKASQDWWEKQDALIAKRDAIQSDESTIGSPERKSIRNELEAHGDLIYTEEGRALGLGKRRINKNNPLEKVNVTSSQYDTIGQADITGWKFDGEWKTNESGKQFRRVISPNGKDRGVVWKDTLHPLENAALEKNNSNTSVAQAVLPSGTAGAPDPVATAAGVIKTAEAAAAAGRPFEPRIEEPGTPTPYGRETDVYDITVGLQRKPLSPAPESTIIPEQKPSVAGTPLPEPTRTEPSPVATPAAAVPVFTDAQKAELWPDSPFHGPSVSITRQIAEEYRKLAKAGIMPRIDSAKFLENGGPKERIARGESTPQMEMDAHTAALAETELRAQADSFKNLREKHTELLREKQDYLDDFGKMPLDELTENVKAEYMDVLDEIVLNERKQKRLSDALPKLRQLIDDWDRIGAQPLPKKRKPTPAAPAAPKPVDTVTPKIIEAKTAKETADIAIEAFEDVTDAWRHLDDQVKALEGDPNNKAVVDRLNAAKRKIANALEDEARAAETAALDVERETQYGLLQSLKDFGGLPKFGKEAIGELGRITEAHRLAGRRFFRKGAQSLDTLREMFSERGFQFDDYYQMLDAIESAVASGKEKYGTNFPPNYRGGPGAMGPVEKAFQDASRKILGGYNADVEAAQIRRGQVPTVSEARKEDPVTFENAMDAIEKNPALPEKLVDDILKKEKKSITDEEQLILTYRRAELDNNMAAESERAIDPSLTPQEQAVHQTNAEVFEAQLLRAEEANRMAGTTWGRAGRSRQMQMNDDYTYAGLMMRERRATGDVVPKERAKELKKTAEEYKKAQAEVDAEVEARKKLDEDAELDAKVDAYEKSLETERNPNMPYSKAVMEWAERMVDDAKKKADIAREWLKQDGFFGSESGAINPGVGGPKGEGKKMGQQNRELEMNRIKALSDIIVERLMRFGLNRAKNLEAIAAMYPKSQPYFDKAYKMAVKLYEKATSGKPTKIKEAIKNIEAIKVEGEKVAKTKPKKSTDTLIGEGRAAVEATGKLSHNIVAQIINGMIEAGNRTRPDIYKRAHEIVKEFMPEATERDVRRAYVEYGKVTTPSIAEKDVFTRKLKAATLLEEHISQASIDRKLPSPKGYRRDKPDIELRDLQKELNELLKDPTLPERPGALASKDEAKQTRIKYRIEELNRLLAEGIEPKKGKPTSPDSVKTEQLRAEKEALEAYVKEVDAAKNPPPPEHLAELERLQDRADILRDRLARMELGKPKAEGKPTVDTAEIAAAKAEIKQLSDTIAELRKPIPLSDAQKALDSALVARERAGQTLDDISTGKVKDPAKVKEALTQLEEDVRLETDALKALAAEMRREAKNPGDPGYLKEQAQIKALERAIANYEKRVAHADFAAKGKVQGPDSQRVTQLKAIRDLRRAAYQAAKDAGKPVLTPEQRWNATRLKALTKREADFKEKIRTGNYARPPKRVSPKMDIPTQDAQIRVDAIKQKFIKEQFDYYQKQRSTSKKIVDGIGQTFRAGININSSTDFSGFRQGMGTTMMAFGKTVFPVDVRRGASGKTQVVLTNPLKSAMMILRPGAKMIVSGISEQKARRMEKARENRPNAKSGAYEEMGIDITNLDTKVRSKHEEMMSSVLDEWAQLPMRTGSTGKTIITAPGKVAAKVVHASNRAFNTLLNEMRLDLADSLLAENYKDRAPTPAELKVLGNLVNIATGRGNINPALARGAGFVFWAPSLFASRVKGLTMEPIWSIKQPFKGTGRARAAVAKEYARVIISGYLLWKTAQMFSDDDADTTNPTSSDFGKIVRGNTRIDPWGGHQQVGVLAARAITGKTTSIKGDERENDLGAVIASFGRNKLRPDWGALWNAYEIYLEKPKPGRPQTYSEVVASMYTPMSLRDIADVMRDRGMAEGAIVEALGMFGAGVSVYGDEEKAKGYR